MSERERGRDIVTRLGDMGEAYRWRTSVQGFSTTELCSLAQDAVAEIVWLRAALRRAEPVRGEETVLVVDNQKTSLAGALALTREPQRPDGGGEPNALVDLANWKRVVEYVESQGHRLVPAQTYTGTSTDEPSRCPDGGGEPCGATETRGAEHKNNPCSLPRPCSIHGTAPDSQRGVSPGRPPTMRDLEAELEDAVPPEPTQEPVGPSVPWLKVNGAWDDDEGTHLDVTPLVEPAEAWRDIIEKHRGYLYASPPVSQEREPKP